MTPKMNFPVSNCNNELNAHKMYNLNNFIEYIHNFNINILKIKNYYYRSLFCECKELICIYITSSYS